MKSLKKRKDFPSSMKHFKEYPISVKETLRNPFRLDSEFSFLLQLLIMSAGLKSLNAGCQQPCRAVHAGGSVFQTCADACAKKTQIRTASLLVTLTSYADDFRPVPSAVGTALSSGHVALEEAVSTLVACY